MPHSTKNVSNPTISPTSFQHLLQQQLMVASNSSCPTSGIHVDASEVPAMSPGTTMQGLMLIHHRSLTLLALCLER